MDPSEQRLSEGEERTFKREREVVVVVCIFRYFHLYLQKSIKKKKREEAEPQGQALAKRTCRGGKTNKQKKMSLERRGAQCKLEAGAILEELKNN